LFLTGQDAAMCGFIGALVGGMCAASVVLGRNMFFQLVGQPPK
jgi:hypothetical protein